ncbi:uncharacterized protein LOC121611801 isoform X2 [Chelmon rostratus]|uniref:uncharacterized protein LOC121611801 isoform X2 n=1 Tax=Chelmon rostratus TaxID=109905 RepID=UPI001BE55472|nr:uncharacterized protein LOC121611801 isoform X2 [Chelmon rostratus]
MIGRQAAFILLSTVYLIQTGVPHQMSYAVVEVGGNITLQCPIAEREGKFFQWYKLPLGDMVQTVASGSYTQPTLGAQFHKSRFKVTNGEKHYLLTIRNVSKEDEATYFCRSGSAYSPNSVNVTFLAVNDSKQQKSVNVKQSPDAASVQPGGSMTLQCSLHSKNKDNKTQCPGEHSVYWFRSGSGESHPAIIYRHTSYEQKEKSCVYSLSKTVRDSSDTGIYYCAVVTCGRILFGEGTKVETRPELDPVVLVLEALLACCVTVIVVLIFYVVKIRRRVCEHNKGTKSDSYKPGHDKSTVEQSADLDGDTEAVNYAALEFSARKVKREKKKTESTQECVYSAVRVDHHTQHQPSL